MGPRQANADPCRNVANGSTMVATEDARKVNGPDASSCAVIAHATIGLTNFVHP